MSENTSVLNSEGKQKWTPPAARVGGGLRWHPSTHFVLAVTLLGDALVIFAALCLGFWVRFDSGLIPVFTEIKLMPALADYFNLLGMGTVFLLGTFGYLRLYNQRCFMHGQRTAWVVVQGTVFWLFAFLAVSLILKFDPPISRLFMVCSFVCVLGGLLLWRRVVFKIAHWDLFAIKFRQRVLFVGWGQEAERLALEIGNDATHPYEIIGCLPSPQARPLCQPPPAVPALGDYHDLPTLLKQRRADIVILADLQLSMGEIIGLVNLCEMEFAQFKVIPSYFQIFASGLRLETISGVPILGVSELPLDRFTNALIKRGMDLIGATVGMIISIPLIAVFGALVYRESPGPIFYRQLRMGRSGRNFHILKIRSMRLDAEENGGAQWAKEDDPRRLAVGAFMRRWNIDEVPQFWNVIKGEMSLVGPRPERPELISQFKDQIPHYHARHSCLPGMTGWAQVNGWRGNTSLEERIRSDIWYVENWSFTMDIRIMILTFVAQKNAY